MEAGRQAGGQESPQSSLLHGALAWMRRPHRCCFASLCPCSSAAASTGAVAHLPSQLASWCGHPTHPPTRRRFKGNRSGPSFKRLPFTHCAISFQPFDDAVGPT